MRRIRTLIMKQLTLFFFEQNALTILLIYQNWMRYVTLAKCLRIVTGAAGSICLKQKLCKYVYFVFIDVNLSLFSHRFIVWHQSLAREQVLKLWQETVMIRNNKKTPTWLIRPALFLLCHEHQLRLFIECRIEKDTFDKK